MLLLEQLLLSLLAGKDNNLLQLKTKTNLFTVIPFFFSGRARAMTFQACLWPAQIFPDQWLCRAPHQCASLHDWKLQGIHAHIPWKVPSFSWLWVHWRVLWLHWDAPRQHGWTSSYANSDAKSHTCLHLPQKWSMAQPCEDETLCLFSALSQHGGQYLCISWPSSPQIQKR